ncbi:MAG: zinc-dependent peptidase [Fimbriimonadaceae bacterium]|nr:zinc-dependent peptidase [Fimbriimonadaceae bacterium]
MGLSYILLAAVTLTSCTQESPAPDLAAWLTQTNKPTYQKRIVSGWTVNIQTELLTTDAKLTERAIDLLKIQLDEIVKVVPKPAVKELLKVQLWFSPVYPDSQAGAAYHPGAAWLKEHGRNPDMVQGVEFTNIRIFDAEVRRMPNFALHELAHAYHDRVLPEGFGNKEVREAYEKAKASDKYQRVEKQDSEGRKSMDKHYALTNPQEYFAESTEAFFTRNDFYPYNATDLKDYDPDTYALIAKLWGVEKK